VESTWGQILSYKGRTVQGGLTVPVCAALTLAPAYCSADCVLRMGKLNTVAPKAADKELRGEGGEASRPRGQEDTVI